MLTTTRLTVLDDFEPKYALKISYPSTHTDVDLGNHIPTKNAQDAPVYEFHPVGGTDTESNKAFHLVLTDPDAKSRQEPIWSEFCHWVIANVSSSGAGAAGKHQRKTLMPYMGPAPPPGTGDHRYVFVLLRGDADKSDKLEAPKERKQWGYGKERHGVRQWAKQHGLEIVGANFFFAKNE